MRATMRGVAVRRGLAQPAVHVPPVLLRTSSAAAAASVPRREHSAAAAARRDLKSLTVPQLKEIVRVDNVVLVGGLRHKRKADLVEAIVEHRTKEGVLRAPRGAPTLHSGSGELAPKPATTAPTVAEIPASIQAKVRSDTPDVVAALSAVTRDSRPQHSAAAPARRPDGPRAPQLAEATAPSIDAPAMVDEALAQAPVVVFSKTFCPYCKDVLELFNRLGLTQAPHVVELDLLERQRMDALQDHLQEMTGARSVPRVFVDSTFIGGADDTVAAHSSGKLAKLLIEAGALPKPSSPPAPAPAPVAASAAAPAATPQPESSAILQNLAALPTRAERKVVVPASTHAAPRAAREAPTLHAGAGELSPVQSTTVVAAPTGPRYSPVSTRAKLDVVQQLQQVGGRQAPAVPRTPAEVEVAKMEGSVKAAAAGKPTPKAAEPTPSSGGGSGGSGGVTSSAGGGSGGGGANGSGVAGVIELLKAQAEKLPLDKLSVPHVAGALAAAWALGLASMYLSKPKTEPLPKMLPTQPTASLPAAIRSVDQGGGFQSVDKEDMAAVLRIMERLDRIEGHVADETKPNPRRDALFKAKKLQGDAAIAGNARNPDEMKRLLATAAELRTACTKEGAGTEAVISAKVAEIDLAEKVEAAAVGVSLGVASGLLVYGLATMCSRR
jgi:glutaredoxin 3